jgi:hypothetical protein
MPDAPERDESPAVSPAEAASAGMPDAPERDESPAVSPAEAASAGPEAAGAGLPRPIQEHLGQQLRTTYNVETAEKPAYLGDPVLPLEFELLLQRLEASERQRIREMAHTQGIEAVERALRDLGAGPAGAEGGLSLPPKGGVG